LESLSQLDGVCQVHVFEILFWKQQLYRYVLQNLWASADAEARIGADGKHLKEFQKNSTSALSLES
jgi:hypothetical protein